VAVEVEDRVADQLARPVEGRPAAAVGLDHLDVGIRGHVDLPVVGAPSDRDHGRVLEEDHGVGRGALLDGGGELALKRQRIRVGRLAEMDHAGVHAGNSRPGATGLGPFGRV
jgi:hypothetical protein